MSSKWELVMKNVMDLFIGNCSWWLTKLPESKKALHNKWVYGWRISKMAANDIRLNLLVKTCWQKVLHMINWDCVQPQLIFWLEGKSLICRDGWLEFEDKWFYTYGWTISKWEIVGLWSLFLAWARYFVFYFLCFRA